MRMPLPIYVDICAEEEEEERCVWRELLSFLSPFLSLSLTLFPGECRMI
jgi:hypothetical protein